MYQWLNMWGNLVHGARAMVDFPIWLQILPKILFKVINRRGKWSEGEMGVRERVMAVNFGQAEGMKVPRMR